VRSTIQRSDPTCLAARGMHVLHVSTVNTLTGDVTIFVVLCRLPLPHVPSGAVPLPVFCFRTCAHPSTYHTTQSFGLLRSSPRSRVASVPTLLSPDGRVAWWCPLPHIFTRVARTFSALFGIFGPKIARVIVSFMHVD